MHFTKSVLLDTRSGISALLAMHVFSFTTLLPEGFSKWLWTYTSNTSSQVLLQLFITWRTHERFPSLQLTVFILMQSPFLFPKTANLSSGKSQAQCPGVTSCVGTGQEDVISLNSSLNTFSLCLKQGRQSPILLFRGMELTAWQQLSLFYKLWWNWTSLAVQWLRLQRQQRAQVRSLIGELRSCMPCSAANK